MEHPTKVTVLPPAGRDEQLKRWGLHPDRIADRRGVEAKHLGPEDIFDWDAEDDTEDAGEALGFLIDGGWHAVSVTDGGGRDGGMTSHRGVLQGGEHVDADALRALVEAELGFTYDEVRAVYRQGPLAPAQRELRNRIDARLLALSRAGGHMAALGQALGFPVKDDGHCRVMENALMRARKEDN